MTHIYIWQFKIIQRFIWESITKQYHGVLHYDNPPNYIQNNFKTKVIKQHFIQRHFMIDIFQLKPVLCHVE